MSTNGHHAAPRARRWRRHPVLTLTFAAVVVAAALAGIGGMQLSQARAGLIAGRADLLAARSALADGDVSVARRHVQRAEARFDRAADDLAHGSLLPARVIPVAAGNIAALREAARGVRTITAALGDLLAAVEQIPGGMDALAPQHGRIALQPLADLRQPAETFASTVSDALRDVRRAADRPLLPPVEEALAELLREGAEAERGAQAAAAAVRAVPALLGADRPMRYFFGAGNPAELRGVGGFLGAYAILTIEDGRFSFGPFRSTGDLESVDAPLIKPPNPDFGARFDRYGGAGFWLNINMTADFPSAAQAITTLYQRTEGEVLDGVITADPIALQALARTGGPVEIPQIGVVQPGELAQVLSNEAFGEFDDHRARKQVLGAVAATIFQRFLGGATAPREAVQALRESAAGGHLLVWAADQELQEPLRAAAIDGALHDGTEDYLHVSGVNGGANKVDFYAERTVAYEAVMEPSGSVRARATVTLENEAPTQGMPKYVIGPNYGDFAAGESATILNVYCGRCAVRELRRNGTPTPINAERELGHPVFWSYERLRSGESVELAYDWVSPGAWRSGEFLSTYRLIIDGQVTIRPTRLQLRLALPEGMALVSSSHDLAEDDGMLTWSGTLDRREEFTVTMRPEGSPVLQALRRWSR